MPPWRNTKNGWQIISMKNAVVIGGKLQGVEALYLAQKAGINTTLIDKNPCPIGQNFCNRFLLEDVIQCSKGLLEVLRSADFVLPAMENTEALSVLDSLRQEYGFTLIYDPKAYGITASKQRTDAMMAERSIPAPQYYPQGDFPYIVKPSFRSGSEGVACVTSKAALEKAVRTEKDLVVQEFLEGPSYSIEIIGTPGHYRVFHITELFMDSVYDCKRVLSRPSFPKALQEQFQEIALALGEMVQLHGIMDVEVIDCNGVLKVLEIDARIPSQTPITVYYATGVNFMEELYQTFAKNPEPPKEAPFKKERYVSFEQLLVNREGIHILGEHIISTAKGLSAKTGFCGSDEAFTDYESTKEQWTATMICVADTKELLVEKRQNMFREVGQLVGKNLPVIDCEPRTIL